METKPDESTQEGKQPVISDWREMVELPVVDGEKLWNTQELEDILRESVEIVTMKALRDNGGVVYTTLSGGVDSSLCLAIISELCSPKTQIHTFTVGGSKAHPDIQFAKEVAQLFNTIHHEIIVDKKARERIIKEFKTFYGNTETTQKMIERADINVWAVYREIAKMGAVSVIAHDGIDELMGGYWRHRQSAQEGKEKQQAVFEEFWYQLQPEHLEPLEQTAGHFGIKLLFPYLQERLVRYIAGIPVGNRASFSSGKIPLKEIARKYVWPKSVVDRPKRGFVDALMEK